MFGKKKRAPQPKGQGAAAAKQVTATRTNSTGEMLTVTCSLGKVLSFTLWFQMGLFVDLDPEEMMVALFSPVN